MRRSLLFFATNLPRTVFEIGIPFLASLGFLFLFNLLLVRVITTQLKRKKYSPALFVGLLVCILNAVFFHVAREGLIERGREMTQNISPLVLDPIPPPRQYDFIKKHKIRRDYDRGLISAVDPTGFSLALQKARPRQVFSDSFYIMMGKEDFEVPDEKTALDYAKFIILIYYGESEPLYPDSAKDLEKVLKGRGERFAPVLKAIDRYKTSKFSEKPAQPVAVPQKDQWDTDGNVLKPGDVETLRLLSRISPPEFKKDWDSSYLFKLYTFSLRYLELVEWQFRISKKTEVQVKKLNRVTF